MGRRVTNEVLNIKANSDTREIDQMERQLRDTSRALGGFEDSGRDAANGAERAEGKFRSLLSAAADLSLVGIGLKGAFDVLGGVFNSTVGAVFDQETAFNRLAAQTGATAEEMAVFRQEAQDIFTANWGDSIDDVADSMSQVERITGATGDELESLTTDAIIIRDLFGADIVESTRAADTMMETFGITGEQAFDLITTGFQETGDPGQDLLDTLNEYSTNFADIGLSAEQSLSILNQGLELGARNTDDLADGLREFNIRMNDATSEAAFMELGLSDVYEQFQSGEIDGVAVLEATTDALGELDNEAQRAALGAQIFGTKYEDLSGIFDEIDFEEVSEEFQDVAGATKDAGNTASKGLKPALESLKRTGMTMLANFLTPFVVKLEEKAVPAMTEAGEWMNDVGIPALQKLGYYIGEAAEVVGILGGMLIEAFGGQDAILGTLADVGSTLGAAFGDISAAVSTIEPESLMFIAGALGAMAAPAVIAGLAAVGVAIASMAAAALVAMAPFALIAAAVYAYETDFAGLKTNLNNIADAIQNRDLGGVLSGVKDVFVDLATEVGNLIGIDVPSGLAAWTGEDGVFSMAKIIVGELAERVADFVTGLPGNLANIGATLITNVQTPFQEVIGGVKALFTDPAEGLQAIVGGLGGMVEGALKTLNDTLGINLLSPFQTVVDAVKLVFNDPEAGLQMVLMGLDAMITAALSTLGGTLGINLTAPFEAAKGVVDTLVNTGLKGLIEGIPGSITTWLSGWVGALNDSFIAPFTDALRAIDDALPNSLTIDLGHVTIPNVLDVKGLVGHVLGGSEMPMVGVDLGGFDIDLPDNPFSSLVSRDTGGFGSADEPYLIGKGAQPEIFVPRTNGTFVPNFDRVLAGAGGQNVNHIVLSLDGRVIYEAYERENGKRVR